VTIDDKGVALSNYERKLLIFWAGKLKTIQSQLSEIVHLLVLDESKVITPDTFAELIHDLHNALQQFHPLLINGLNCILINKIAPDHSKISEYRISIEKRETINP
jgi:hypothetical protein